MIHRKTGVRTSPGDSFDALQIDSLGMAELTVEIEKAFGIRVGDDIMDVLDIAGLIAHIEERIACRPVPQCHKSQLTVYAARILCPLSLDLSPPLGTMIAVYVLGDKMGERVG